MSSMQFLIGTLFDLYLMVVILRLWLQFARADFYNPFSQFVVRATHPLVGPMRRVLPSLGKLDTATLVLALLVAFIKLTVENFVLDDNSWQLFNPLAILLGSVIVLVNQTLSLIFWILIIRALLSWFSQGQNPMEMVLYQLTEPLLAPIRRIIPPMGGLDLSVLIAIIAIQFLTFLLRDLGLA
ncbi:YggT family protein [Bowmanella yangjiangensis]|uniref:YggT family protein n=1 Tax=Bowmanella yangjiangensis TaxID=2811230 RepID=A0ABS3CQ69_9ALTE|nr:YggT family protein [Bowmanella yangjiangensis]MBN7818311.1 YggT family protein [Bowmanella yangjiangensis]